MTESTNKKARLESPSDATFNAQLNAQLNAPLDYPPTPSVTLYIQNLPSKGHRLTCLRRHLYHLLLPFGAILSLRHTHRSHAYVTFSHLSHAMEALKSLQECLFFGKVLRVSYARQVSHPVAKWMADWKEEEQQGMLLAIQGWPSACTEEEIRTFCGRYQGHLETRLVHKGTEERVALVSFTTAKEATQARLALNHWQMAPNAILKVTQSMT